LVDETDGLLELRKEPLNLVQDSEDQTVADLRKECPSKLEKLEFRANASLQNTSDAEKEQFKRDLRATEERAYRLEAKLSIIRKLLEDNKVDAEYETASKRSKELVEREVLLRPIQKEQNVGNESSSESRAEDRGVKSDGEITEHESQYCITGRELNERRWNSYWKSVERAEERFTIEGTSGLPGGGAICGNYEAAICEEGAASFTSVPSAASSDEGRAGGQSVKCPICLCEFGTQEVGTPESCNHSFCVDCLHEWSEKSNTCPVDREVYDAILVRASLGGEVVRRIHVESRSQRVAEVIEHVEHCEACSGINFDNRMIYCDRCGRGYHPECMRPPLANFPLPLVEEWFCRDCYLPSPLYVDYEE
jgi:hypothetical protein